MLRPTKIQEMITVTLLYGKKAFNRVLNIIANQLNILRKKVTKTVPPKKIKTNFQNQ